MEVERRERSAHAEVEAGDRFGDDVFLNLDQIGVGEGHAERSENIAAACNDDERAGPIVVIGFAAIVILDSGQSTDCRFALRNFLIVGVDVRKVASRQCSRRSRAAVSFFLDRRRATSIRFACPSRRLRSATPSRCRSVASSALCTCGSRKRDSCTCCLALLRGLRAIRAVAGARGAAVGDVASDSGRAFGHGFD